jgi:RNA polymerase sigma-70 factor (ECF subfamily)
VLREARRLTGDDHAAEDVVQLTLARAWRHRAACADPGAPLPWVIAIARNEARRWFVRPAAREIPGEVADDRRLGGVASAEDRTLVKLSVEQVVNRLSPDDRRLLTLRYAEDLTHSEIARRLSWPEGTVKVRLHRLRRRLATELEPDS